MPFYEVIYETGAHSVMSGTDEEVTAALTDHHERATKGAPGGPAGQPAERVKKVLKYDEHPGSYGESGTMSGEVAQAELSKRLKGKPTVGVEEVAAEVRALSSAVDHDALAQSSHNSMFKAESTGELDGAWSK